ncbi:hypothetical protein EV361DRAFT_936170 [Lentinula raphanica]|nr:hypothetical protein EV361DRAFT_936170 [Lentinula raphanica]
MQGNPYIVCNAKRPSWMLNQIWCHALTRPISHRDRPGIIYVFFEIGQLGGDFKVGRTCSLRRRAREWAAKCPGKRREWLGAFWT